MPGDRPTANEGRFHVTAAPASLLLSKLIKLYVRSGARGSTRCTFFLARHLRSLQAVPITIDGRRLFVDLRDGLSHALLARSPWTRVSWEVDEQLIMRRLVRPGDVVFDVGAHIGFHTALLSEIATPRGCVHAFEPNPAKIPALRLTAEVCGNAIVHPFGLSRSETQATLFVPVDESKASLRDWTSGSIGAVRPAPCELKSMDSLVASGALPRPDFIKCDVEGAELDVFLGAAQTLDQPRAPIILYEACLPSAAAFGYTISAATDWLRALPHAEYRVSLVQPGGRLEPFERFSEASYFHNLVAIPRERCAEFA
jgi:FkbM family methyltransferase